MNSSQRSITDADTGSSSARPYRSHKVRACDFCRRRKVRCAVDVAGKPCHLCHINKVDCTYDKEAEGARATTQSHGSPTRPAPHARPGRQHQSNIEQYTFVDLAQSPVSVSNTAVRFQHNADLRGQQSNLGSARPTKRHRDIESTSFERPSKSIHIIGPVTSGDAQILEEYMSPKSPDRPDPSPRLFNHYSAQPGRPVLYTTVPRYRQGLSTSSNPGKGQREIMEQIVAPFTHEVVKTFFERINPAFPVLDYETFMKAYQSNNMDLSSTIVCEVYVITLTFWRQSAELSRYPSPDPIFAWNLAVQALQDDFLAPSFSTIQAALLDLSGRPVTSIIGNGITSGRTVALAYSLGLNRDPRDWSISLSEQNLRIRLWWCVFIHDQWASLSHGTPPHIVNSHCDVGLPNPDTMVDAVPHGRYGSETGCFISLCQLTKILSDVLPLIYSLQTSHVKETTKSIRRVEMKLDEWEESLPEQLLTPESSDSSVSGSCSLRLGYLMLKVFICRILLHATTHSLVIDDTARLYHQAQCRTSAKAVVDFLATLKKSHLDEFWLPYAAYHFTSTATLLLRCALETEDDAIADSCITSVQTLIDQLRRAKADHGWDLGDICIAQCGTILNRMTTNHNGKSRMASPSATTAQINPGIMGFQQYFNDPAQEFIGDMEQAQLFNPQMGDLWDMFRFEDADFGFPQPQ